MDACEYPPKITTESCALVAVRMRKAFDILSHPEITGLCDSHNLAERMSNKTRSEGRGEFQLNVNQQYRLACQKIKLDTWGFYLRTPRVDDDIFCLAGNGINIIAKGLPKLFYLMEEVLGRLDDRIAIR